MLKCLSWKNEKSVNITLTGCCTPSKVKANTNNRHWKNVF